MYRITKVIKLNLLANSTLTMIELQHEIEELQGIVRVKPRIASLDDAHKLLEQGYDML
jgi:hypothetical protein